MGALEIRELRKPLSDENIWRKAIVDGQASFHVGDVLQEEEKVSRVLPKHLISFLYFHINVTSSDIQDMKPSFFSSSSRIDDLKLHDKIKSSSLFFLCILHDRMVVCLKPTHVIIN